MNKVILIGRLTRDSEIRYTESQIAVCEVNLAVDREYKKDEADFIKCKVFGKLGETLNKYTKKGDLIALSGRIQTGSYEKDGKKNYTFEVIADSIKFLQQKKEETTPEIKQTTKVESDPYADFGQSIEITDDDLPF